MHFMSACSVARACNESAGDDAKVSSSNPDICVPFNHVATVCRLDIGMGRMLGKMFDCMLLLVQPTAALNQ
jgi:hypothetical protein